MSQFNSHKINQFIMLLFLMGIVFSCIDGDLFVPDPNAPKIDDFTPKSGLPGTVVTINGSNFAGTLGMDSVFVNGAGAVVVNSSPIQLQIMVPENATTGPIAVRELNHRQRAVSNEDFEVITESLPLPTIHKVEVSPGVEGSSFKIIGTNFGKNKNDLTVRIGLDTTIVSSVNDSVIVTSVPIGAKTGLVTIIKDGVLAIGPLFTVLYVGPIIDTLLPDHGPVGTMVWVFGKYFSSLINQNTITFNGVVALVLEAHNDSLKTAVPPNATSGKVVISVNGKNGEWPLFQVDGGAPKIVSINPTTGKIGIVVTIHGENFAVTSSQNTVTFHGAVAVVNSASSTELKVTVPNNATTGQVVVSVNGLSAIGPVFTVEQSSPHITSLNPASGQIGSSVSITGTNFSPTASNNTVTFNGTAATVTSASATTLVVTVPAGATTGPVVVKVGSLSSNGVSYTVNPTPPQVTSINPSSGPYDTRVTITGYNFSNVVSENQVTFNGTNATLVSANTTTIVATVPPGAGTGAISVTTNGLTDIGPIFTYIKTLIVNTFAGNGNAGFVNGPAATAQFNGPSRMAVNAAGEIVLADFNNHSIRKVDTKGNVSTIAGDGTPGMTNGNASVARFARPFGVAIDNSGNIFIADYDNNVIRRISTSNIVSTYAGIGQPGFTDGASNSAAFYGPIDVVTDASGNVYVADLNNHAIRRIDTNGNVTTIAGNGTSGFVNAKGTMARFNYPDGLGIDNLGNIIVADLANHAIRKVAPNGEVTTIAGNGTAGSTDGSLAAARFNFPYDVDLDASGNIYVADDKNHKIRIIKTNNTVGTFAGSGIEGYLNGEGTVARFNDPTGIVVINSELVYVGDTENNRIRIITLK